MNAAQRQSSATKTRRLNERRVLLLQCVLGVFMLLIVARLLEIQIVRFQEFKAQAEVQHFGDVRLAVARGEIYSASAKTEETSILATNTTLSLLYVDPFEVSDPTLVAETLAPLLVTDEVYSACSQGLTECPRELRQYFLAAFDPLQQISYEFDIQTESGAEVKVEPLPLAIQADALPDKTEVTRLFARTIEEKISVQRVTFVPLLYGANNQQLNAVEALDIAGITVDQEQRLIYGNPEEMNPLRLPSNAQALAAALNLDSDSIRSSLRQRPLRYTPIMRKLNNKTTEAIRAVLLQSAEDTNQKIAESNGAVEISDPLRGVVLLAESWRQYPDSSVAAQVLGFTNDIGEPQYGIERTFNPQLRGKEGRIRTASDREGLQIITNEQTVEAAEDGDTVILTIDRVIQKKVEEIMMADLQAYQATTGQALVMDPQTGRILAMVNVPTFSANEYTDVYKKTPIYVPDQILAEDLVAELYHPVDNTFIVRAEPSQILTQSGRTALSSEKAQQLNDLEELYAIDELVRYYIYTGEVDRYEVFPTENKNVWLKYANKVGLGAYLNRTVQEIYEPGSVAKAITMAAAIDQGEVEPSDTYNDTGPIEVDEYTINNAEFAHYGTINMTNCLEFSVNTCMTMVSEKLGRKLFHRVLTNFGFGKITGIELEDELGGELRPWRQWSQSELATHSFGQGISATPLQMIAAFSALGNGGKLMKPTIVDRIIHADGEVSVTPPTIVNQVIRPETSETITAMLTSVVSRGQAKRAQVPGYRIAGKTGTSQIAGPSGRYEKGEGTTRTTFAGYAPIDHPRFTILVKFDRPLIDEYGSTTAAPTFAKIASFMFEYLGIPPDAR